MPRNLVASTAPAVEVLSGRRGRPASFDASLLATLLFLGAGVTRQSADGRGGPHYFRAAMSAGNLHPIEVYVVAGPDLEGIAPGVQHFAPLEFGLTELRRGDFRAFLSVEAPLALVLTGLVWRTVWKYGERGWRHLYWDAGTLLANLLAAADAYGLEAEVRTGFADEELSELVGIDGVDEMALAVVTLGGNVGRPGDAQVDLSPISFGVQPVAPNPNRLPLLIEAQSGSSLVAADVELWRQQATIVSSAAPVEVSSPAWVPEEGIEAVILRRGSTRIMVQEPVEQDALDWPMRAATRAVPLDAAPRGSLLQHFVNVHAVSGIAPGAHAWVGGDLELIATNSLARESAQRLCLDQPIGGDSAYTVFHHADLDSILIALGSRGYRAAQLEAGIVSGRLALAAFAAGLGATGLTFFDDAVSRYFQTSTAPMLVTAVGVPATTPAPAGRPGKPKVLGGFDRLMERLSL